MVTDSAPGTEVPALAHPARLAGLELLNDADAAVTNHDCPELAAIIGAVARQAGGSATLAGIAEQPDATILVGLTRAAEFPAAVAAAALLIVVTRKAADAVRAALGVTVLRDTGVPVAAEITGTAARRRPFAIGATNLPARPALRRALLCRLDALAVLAGAAALLAFLRALLFLLVAALLVFGVCGGEPGDRAGHGQAG